MNPAINFDFALFGACHSSRTPSCASPHCWSCQRNAKLSPTWPQFSGTRLGPSQRCCKRSFRFTRCCRRPTSLPTHRTAFATPSPSCSASHRTKRRGVSSWRVSPFECNCVREKMCVSCVLQSGIDHLPGCAPLPAHIPLYLYPFLNTVSKARPFEYLRLTSLGVIGALVKVRLRPTS